MKLFISILLSNIVLCSAVHSQNLILNGSFETNTATGNTLNLTSNWASTVASSFEVDGGSMDLITSNNCGVASNGNWFVTCSPIGGTWPYLAFSLELAVPLSIGAQYTLTFDKRFCGPNSSPIDVGLSNDSSLMGMPIHTFSAPATNSWTSETYVFQAPIAAKFLSVNVGIAGSTGTVGLDNFSLTATTTNIEGAVNPNKISIVSTNQSNSLSFMSSFINPEPFQLYNAIGKLIRIGQINNGYNQIDLSSLSSGVYCIKVGKEKGIAFHVAR